MLRVNHTVNWRSSWGKASPKKIKVTNRNLWPMRSREFLKSRSFIISKFPFTAGPR